MKIYKNKDIKRNNTFQFDAVARYLCCVTTHPDLMKALLFGRQRGLSMMVLGGGSNVVMSRYFDGLVIYMQMPGIEVVESGEKYYLVKAAGGVIWDELVEYCLEHHMFGIENLAMIPGTVGAAPIQNIGAYGVELENIFYSLEAVHLNTGDIVCFDRLACQFGYRDSIFKNDLKDQFIIVAVTLKLLREPLLILRDKALAKELAHCNPDGVTISPRDVANAVRRIRVRRLPALGIIGNAGSFFVNPVVSRDQYLQILEDFPSTPGHMLSPTEVKLSAGWLIDQCGYRGTRYGDAGVYSNNPLVLVNYGSCNAAEILCFADMIRRTVKAIFNVELVMEPRNY